MSDLLKTAEAVRNYPHDGGKNPCPPLTVAEREALKASIEENGFVAAFPISRSAGPACEGELIDGFHRTAVCEELGIEPVTVYVPCATETEFRVYQIMANVTRRQLATHQKAALAAELHGLLAQLAKERQGTRTDLQSGQSDLPQLVGESDKHAGEAGDQAAKAVGISRETLRQYEAVLAADNAEQLLEQIESGAKSVKRAFQTLRDVDTSIKNEAQAERELAEYFTHNTEARHDERERATGDLVRLLMEADALQRKHSIEAADVARLRSRPHTFLGAARRLNEWLGEIEEVLS